MEQIQGVVVETLAMVLLALITLAGAFATNYIKKVSAKLNLEMQTLEDINQKRLIGNALERLEIVAEKTVNKIEQTTAKKLREAVKDGKVERKELENLAKDAYQEIICTMEPEYVAVIQASLGDAQTYIMNTIEEKVEMLKEGTKVLR